MSDEVWTIQAALDWCRSYLQRKGDENPRLSAEWLLCEACHMRRVELYVNFERPLSPDERATLRDWVARRGAGEPLQYITGEVAFRHIAVKVREGVLIPRPETEVLVSEALALLPAPERRRALDSTLTVDEFEQLQAEAAAKADLEASGVVDGALPGQDGAGGVGDEVERVADATIEVSREEADSSCDDVLYVADICTGSGCIACSIAFENPRQSLLRKRTWQLWTWKSTLPCFRAIWARLWGIVLWASFLSL